MHLGIGKSFAASSLVVFATFLPGNDVDERFEHMSALYAQYCKSKHLDRLVQKLDIHMCGGGGSSEAIGTWNKAALTSNLCLFIERLCDLYLTGFQRMNVFNASNLGCIHFFVNGEL